MCEKTHDAAPGRDCRTMPGVLTSPRENEKPETRDMPPHLLIYRAILVNVIGFALLAIAALKGWVAELIVHVIFVERGVDRLFLAAHVRPAGLVHGLD